MLQMDALNVLKMGKNIFLTGAAGSGKTYLLNQYIAYLKQNAVGVAITASTGIAATHLHGNTIHTWSGIGVKDNLTRMDLDKLIKNSRVKRNYKKTKVLIIDEISMLHRHQLDMVDTVARFFLDAEKPFGGMQIILCGDFFQLPPVTTSVVEKQFAFEAAAFEAADFHVCYLHEQYRQGQDPLLQILNDIRSGTAGEHTKVPLRTRYKKEPVGATKPTKLYSRNINVDAINQAELERLPGAEKIFNMTTSGFSVLVDALKKSCLASPQLKLKIGAEVMFIKNDNFGQYVNGTRGVVMGFDSTEGWPLVKTFANTTLMAIPEAWNFEENGIIQASIKQVPLRLAWAITIHKSQGMTLDAAEIDLGDAFEPGMGYVALSRVRSLQGLKLMNLNEMALTVHPKILEQDKVFKARSLEVTEQFQSISKEDLEKMQGETLHLRFEANKTKEKQRTPKKSKKDTPIPTHEISLNLLKENASIQYVATQRGLSVGTILNHIEKLCSLKKMDQSLLDSLKNSVPKEDFDLIFSEMKKSADGKLTPLYEQFSGKYPYTTLKIVRMFVKELISD